MGSVFGQSLRGYRLGIALTALGLFGVSLLVTYTFEAFGGLEAAQELEDFLPDSLKALLKAQGGFATDATGFLAADYRHPIYLVPISAFVIATASGAMAREIEHGTILVLLACPIARWRFLLAKAGAMLAGMVILLACAWVGTWVGSVITGIADEVVMTVFLRVLLNMLVLAMAIGGISLVLSALSSDGGQTVALAAGISVTMFFIDFLAVLWSPVETLGFLSVFHYYDPLAIARNGGIPWRDMAVLFGVGVTGLAAATVIFQRRDISR